MLLSYADLPLFYRARACAVLALSTAPGYVEWAEEAVRIWEVGIQQCEKKGESASEKVQELYVEYQKILEQARADFEECGGYEEEEGEEEAGEEVVVQETGKDDDQQTEPARAETGVQRSAAQLQTRAQSSDSIGPRDRS